ncbi:MAG: TlpA family protein disulfide reductase [Methylococcaceae bacterium]|nr:MAG: TlpA family protein disulfide reductase [Methylococcaceae bacterium]
MVVGLLLPQLVLAVGADDPAPNCKLKSLQQDALVDLNYQGKVTYVDFWASWCGPCAQSMPFMNEMSQQLAGQGFNLVAVNMDENRQDAEAFLSKHPVSFSIVADIDGQCAGAFGVQAMPSSYLIDRHGKVRHVQLGFHDSERDEIRQKVRALLAEP